MESQNNGRDTAPTRYLTSLPETLPQPREKAAPRRPGI